MYKSIQFLARFGLTLQILKTALAAAVAWFVATSLLHAEYPYFAAIAAILTVQVTVADSVDKASQRIIGIIGGVLVSMVLGRWFEIGALSIFLVILIGMGFAKALRLNPQIISQVAVSSLLVLAFGNTRHGYGYERIIETMIGSGIAVLINALIVPQNAIPDVERSIRTFSNLAQTTLIQLTSLLDTSGKRRKTGRSEVDALIREAENCHQTLKLAEQSLKYNPFLTPKRTRLKRLALRIKMLEQITTQIRGIRRGLADLQETDINHNQAILLQLKGAMEATANCIGAFGEAILDHSEPRLRTLRTCILEARSQQTDCLLNLRNTTSLEILRDLGSILTDLSRIVTETEVQHTSTETP
ncbi:FUSC family protein [Pontibacter liquoris]|uniref:FUSC family protein n=1 Tax=Pontibacter liquoris TaxID=2905677 RepID=UPI001FA7FEAD|nr:aromatic acid exporter family protein [Pontibacter liquoris]